MKKFVFLLIVLSMLASALGCTTASPTSSPTADAGQAEAAGKDLGMLVPTLQSEFFISLSNDLKDYLAAKGYNLTVMSYDGDINKSISIVENFTIQGVDGIIAMVGDKSSDAALKAAMDKGIKVIEAGVLTDYYHLGLVGDNKDIGTRIGEMAAEYINTELGGTAEVLAFVNDDNPDMGDRSSSMVEALLKNAPGVTIVGKVNYAQVGEASAAMENYFQKNPNIKVVVSFGDTAAIEAIEVAKAANKTEGFAAFGCDATLQALQIIAEGGLMKGTVDMGSIVQLMGDGTIRLMEGDPTLPKIMSGTNTKVTIDNVDEFLK